jgi:3-keto-disaccharide hydrolase
MQSRIRPCLLILASLPCLLPATARSSRAGEEGWTSLIGESTFEAWRKPTGTWYVAGDARLAESEPKRLVGSAGKGVIINGADGRTRNLYTKEEYGDLEVHLEFLISRGSNSGIKFQGLYEIQICDSRSAAKLTGSDNGGVYPRAELLPRYHHIDDGYAPRSNASRPPGEWQSLDAVFKSPRFDQSGKKIANARFVKVVLNGEMVHENLEVRSPTGHAWRLPEVRRGPLMLQADHGPVAFRNIRIRAQE